MINSSERDAIMLFDRKSPRHWWIIVAMSYGDAAESRLGFVAKVYQRTCAGKHGWEKYQQKIVTMRSESGEFPDSLPVSDRQGTIIYGE